MLKNEEHLCKITGHEYNRERYFAGYELSSKTAGKFFAEKTPYYHSRFFNKVIFDCKEAFVRIMGPELDITKKTPEAFFHITNYLDSIKYNEKIADNLSAADISAIFKSESLKLSAKESSYLAEYNEKLQKREGNTIEEDLIKLVGTNSDPDMSTVRQILGEDININYQNSRGETALMSAANRCRTEIVSMLLKSGANPNIQDNTGKTALVYAAGCGKYTSPCGDIESMRMMVNAGGSLEDKIGTNALMYAASCNNSQVLEFLLRLKIDPNKISGEGSTPLMVAAYWEKKDAIKILLDANADLNLTDSEGNTALDLAISNKKSFYHRDANEVAEIVKMLQKTKNPPSKKDIEYALKCIALQYASNITELRKALRDGADPNCKDGIGRTVLWHACFYEEKKDLAKELIKAGADKNMKDINGDAPSCARL
ncbi:MAG: ankyrin repeat domain-containing protein [Elusimicrobiota bacterium]|nr:ankyrin repeat domain-containing protein [Elusimicrobiota bacterium]